MEKGGHDSQLQLRSANAEVDQLNITLMDVREEQGQAWGRMAEQQIMDAVDLMCTELRALGDGPPGRSASSVSQVKVAGLRLATVKQQMAVNVAPTRHGERVAAPSDGLEISRTLTLSDRDFKQVAWVHFRSLFPKAYHSVFKGIFPGMCFDEGRFTLFRWDNELVRVCYEERAACAAREIPWRRGCSSAT